MPEAKAKRPPTPGRRVGTKHRDMRWEAEGQIWDSRFEYEVFRVYRYKGIDIRRCTAQDSLRYTRPVRNAECTACGADSVVTTHTYTPDFFVSTGDEHGKRTGYYLEVKGYLRADRRSLLRALRKERKDVDLRVLCQRDYQITDKHTLVTWCEQYLKCPCHVWRGEPV